MKNYIKDLYYILKKKIRKKDEIIFSIYSENELGLLKLERDVELSEYREFLKDLICKTTGVSKEELDMKINKKDMA